MDPIRINDRMVTNDDLIITNKIKHECAAPHGRLFQILGIGAFRLSFGRCGGKSKQCCNFHWKVPDDSGCFHQKHRIRCF